MAFLREFCQTFKDLTQTLPEKKSGGEKKKRKIPQLSWGGPHCRGSRILWNHYKLTRQGSQTPTALGDCGRSGSGKHPLQSQQPLPAEILTERKASLGLRGVGQVLYLTLNLTLTPSGSQYRAAHKGPLA